MTITAGVLNNLNEFFTTWGLGAFDQTISEMRIMPERSPIDHYREEVLHQFKSHLLELISIP
jgi:hypothetical protein